jgi:hypothetical protein
MSSQFSQTRRANWMNDADEELAVPRSEVTHHRELPTGQKNRELNNSRGNEQ